MTQAKKGFDLAKNFRALSEREQNAITYYFNLHNIAHFIYEDLSQEAKDVVCDCIRTYNVISEEEEKGAQEE